MNQLLLLSVLLLPFLLAFYVASRRAAADTSRRSNAELMQARAELALTTERLRLAIEATRDGIWDWDIRTDQVYYSPRWKALVGYADDELPNLFSTWESLAHPDDRQKTLDTLSDHLKSRKPHYQVEFRMRHKNGAWIWIEARGRVLSRDAAGAPLRMSGVAADITERKVAEQTLRDSEARIRSIFEQANDAIVLISSDNRFLDVNRRGLEMTGYTREEFLSLGVQDVLAPHERERLSGESSEMLAGKPHLAIWRHQRKDGSTFNAEVSARRLDEASYIAIVRDLTEREEARAAIEEYERRFKSTVENVQLLGVALDTSGRITFCNDYLMTCTGWQRDQIIGRNWFELFVPDTAGNNVQHIFERAMASGSIPLRYENEILTRDRRLLLVRWNNTILRSSKGEVIGTLSLGEDITERVRAHEALHRSEQRLRDLIDGLGPYMFVGLLDPSGVILEANRCALEAAGLRLDDVLGRHVAETYWWSHSADVQLQIRSSVERAAKGESSRFDIEARARGDEVMTLDFSIQPLKNKSGVIEFLVPSAIVISERKLAEKALQESESRLRLALEAAHLGTFEWNVVSNHIVWSPWHEELWGFAPGEFNGTFEAFSERVHPEDLPSVNLKVLASMKERTPYHHEFRVIWPDRSIHWISGRGEFTFDAEGNPIRMYGAVVEITALKQAESTLQRWAQELEHRVAERTVELEAMQAELRLTYEALIEQYSREQAENRRKGEFLATMSHELRTPLNAIIGFTELMAHGRAGEVSQQQVEYLGDISSSAKHLLYVINDVLELARIQAGRLEFRVDEVDLVETVNEIAAAIHPLLLAKNMTLEMEVNPALSSVHTDLGKLKQVLYNYLSNAIKFSDPGTRIILRASSENDREFRIEVQDFGIGIRQIDQLRLFEEFEQLDLSTARKLGGTGLGLALTKRVVEAQGGRVGVRSTFRHGSTFYAVLPRLPLPAVESDAKALDVSQDMAGNA